MPWKLEKFTILETERYFKVYPNGTSVMATDEEIAIWNYVQTLLEKQKTTEEKPKRK